MSGNKYLNFGLMCLVEIPGYTLAWVSIKYLGRRTSQIGSFLICGVTCIAAGFIPQGKIYLYDILTIYKIIGCTKLALLIIIMSNFLFIKFYLTLDRSQINNNSF